jgi:hypothetical protein
MLFPVSSDDQQICCVVNIPYRTYAVLQPFRIRWQKISVRLEVAKTLEAEALPNNAYKHSVLTVKETQHFSITKINRLMLIRKIIAVYSENSKNLRSQSIGKMRVTDFETGLYIYIYIYVATTGL